MKQMKTIICSVMVICMFGCSAFRPNNQTIKISCNVEDTTLKVNGDKYECPNEVSVRRDSKVTVEGFKNGYDKYYKQIDYHFSSSAKWDLVGTAFLIFPVFGLMYPGAWDLDTTEIKVVLTKNK